VQIVVLGSAAGGGYPQWNCACEGCRRARAGDPKARPRTQASLAVSANGRAWYLLNASPDIRQQIDRTPCLHPRPQGGECRCSPIAGVVLTNADVDHVAGLLSLRERQPMTVYGAARVLSALDANAIFNVLDRSVVRREQLPLEVEVRLGSDEAGDDDLSITAFAVPGKVALWLEEMDGRDLGGAPGDTIGFEVGARSTGTRFFYIPGCASVPADLAIRLAGAPLVFFDGTTWTEDEMRSTGVGTKTAQRMGHMSMAGPAGSMAALASLDIGRKIFIHINNTNPVLLTDSPERREAQAQGWEIAEDGMEIRL
jgi:pyrroloquinoline quinone biosynthesis protein B